MSLLHTTQNNIANISDHGNIIQIVYLGTSKVPLAQNPVCYK